MKRSGLTVIWLLILGWPAALAVGGSTMPDDQSIREVVRRWDAAWNAHDMHAMATLLTEDADFVNIAGLHWKGRSQIESEHAERHRTNLKESVSATRHIGIQMLAPTMALVHVDWSISGDKDFDGTPRSPREGIFTWVMQKQDGMWLIRAAQNTTSIPRK